MNFQLQIKEKRLLEHGLFLQSIVEENSELFFF